MASTRIAARNRRTARVFAVLALAGVVHVGPVAAQESPDARLRRIEGEVRALQRRVFPGGSDRYFGPEIAPGSATGAPLPASGPLTDLIARLDGVERALARATAQQEESANRMNKLEARLATLETRPAEPAGSSEPALGSLGGGSLGVGSLGSNPPARPAAATPVRPNTGPTGVNAVGTAGAPRPQPGRLIAATGIEKPVSDDPAEDDYVYGYRLWEAKLFPQAQEQLKLTVERYPRHKRVSYSRNLLGRAYLDDGKPGAAAQVFLENYQADKKGARASDSLLFLAVAMTRLKETQRACVALAELADAYPAEVAGRLAGQYAAAKSAVQCN